MQIVDRFSVYGNQLERRWVLSGAEAIVARLAALELDVMLHQELFLGLACLSHSIQVPPTLVRVALAA